MSITEETKRILKMLEALKPSEGTASTTFSKPKKARWIRFRIYEGGREQPSINLKFPIRLVDLGLKIGGRYLPDSGKKDLQEALESLVEDPEGGKFLEIVDHDDGDRIEITLE